MKVDMSNVERVVGGTFKVLSSIDTVTLESDHLCWFSNTDDLPNQDGSIRVLVLKTFAGKWEVTPVSSQNSGVTGDDFVVLMTNIGKGMGGLLGGGRR